MRPVFCPRCHRMHVHTATECHLTLSQCMLSQMTFPRCHTCSHYYYILSRNEDDTDSCDTDDDCKIGGVGFYSHGDKCLTHQHWVDQLIAGGSFGVHCTQSAEAVHKICMKLTSSRVRHLHVNKTQSSMLKYLTNFCSFEELKKEFPCFRPPVVRARRISSGVWMPLYRFTEDTSGDIEQVSMSEGVSFTNVRFQSKILHRDVRITRSELLDLLCIYFEMPQARESYIHLQSLRYHFGQKLIHEDGEVYWATETDYTYGTANNHRRRRDIVMLKGSVHKKYTTRSGLPLLRRNALCCEMMCFLRVSNLHSLPLPRAQNHVTLALVRWFEPHSSCPQRDQQHRPVCPGPLNINHCLWRYAITGTNRKALVTRNDDPTAGFRRQSYMFGNTPREQLRALALEKQQYFGLINPSSITEKVNITPCFQSGTSEFDTTTWMQSVVMI